MRGTPHPARIRPFLAAALAALALLAATGCEDSGGSGYGAGPASPPARQGDAGASAPAGTPAASEPAPAADDPAPAPGSGSGSGSGSEAAPASVTTAESGLGPILVDGNGRTLYAFTKDKPGTTSCDADCIAVWPAFTSAAELTATGTADPALLGETRLGEGADQAVYGDWPLYYYVGDVLPGDVNGQGLDGEWFAVAADGTLVKDGVESVA
ncbi:COG4315 family predicted lipoprotein [Streptomyces genisteinicus]|uniref:Lipoprotein n=1 Tax=Streptomyces genisteinicus TaxID=2768068 RepID=A0A7H0HSH2_9ACTN|nr:hypothetical protein [Streptomyces genisteinicus]QNP63488.1 hypothetical protein IAG43_11475 [Streptomyces genisteinicus]